MMTIPQSAAEILNEHVTLEVEGIDRMYLNDYVPCLQIVEGVLGFIRRQGAREVYGLSLRDHPQQHV
jgi:hypothetical protein